MSLVDTVKNAFVPIHREGYPFIAAFGAVTLLLGCFSTDPVLDRPDPDRLVRLFLPRSRARHAGRRPAGDQPGRRRRLGGRPGRAAARTWPRHRRDDPHLGVHECVFLPCEPRAGARQDHQDRASAGQIPQRRARQGEQRERAQRPRHRQPQRHGRCGADRRPGGAAHRLLGRGRWHHRHRRAFRPDPLRLARRCLPAALPRRRASPSARRRSAAKPCIAEFGGAAATPLVRIS